MGTTADTAPKTRKGRANDRGASTDVERLWKRYRKAPGDETRNRLVEAYQSLVHDVVRRFGGRLPRSVDRGDLETAGSVGLISAIEGFDPERGVRFESYCEMRVKGSLLDELRSQDWLPRPWRQRVESHKRALSKLRNELSRPPTDGEVAEEMELTAERYQQLFGVGIPSGPTGSMPADDGEPEGNSLLEVVPDTQSEAPGERFTREELLQIVAQRLTEQEYRIVYLKYWEELSMREIGLLAGLSESRVCKVHTRLLERLRDRFRTHVELD